METLNMSGGDEPKKKKKKGVDDCTDGQCAPKTKAKMSLRPSKFNPTKSQHNVGVYKEDPEPPQTKGGLHMNMNQLGGNPGDTQLQKQNSKSAITPAQETEGRKYNSDTRKEKKKMRLSGQ